MNAAAQRRARGGWKSRLGAVALLAAAAVLVLRDPEWKRFDSAAFLESLAGLDWGWTAVGVTAAYGVYLLHALRWRAMIRPLKADAGLWPILEATVLGFAALLIAGRAAEPVRPYLIARREGLPVAGQIAVWALERGLDIAFLLGLSALAASQAGWPALSGAAREGVRALAGIAAAGWLALLLATPLIRRGLGRMMTRLAARSGRKAELARQVLEGAATLGSLRGVVGCLAWSAALWALKAVSYAAILGASSPELRFPPSDTLVFMGLVMAGSLLQIPALGGGLQIAVALVLTEVFGASPETASAAAVHFWAIGAAVTLLPTAALLIAGRVRAGELSRVESDR